jgi:D-serine dehydratase
MGNATHVLWTTGGVFVPQEEYRGFYLRGERIAQNAA